MQKYVCAIAVCIIAARAVPQARGQSALSQPVPVASIQHGFRGSVRFDFLRNGRFLMAWCTASSDGPAVAIWDTNGWKLEKRLSLPRMASYDVHVLEQSEILITGSNQDTDRPRQYTVSVPDGIVRPVDSVVSPPLYSPNRLLCAYQPLDAKNRPDHTRIIVQRLDSGENILDFRPYRLVSRILAFSPDSRYLVYAGANFRPLKRPPPEIAQELRVEPPFRLWDVETRKQDFRAVPGRRDWHFVGFTSDMKKLIVAGMNEIQVTDFATGRMDARFECVGSIGRVAKSPDGGLVAFRVDRAAVVWNHSLGTAVRWRCHDYGPNRISFSPDGIWVVSYGAFDASLYIWSSRELVSMMREVNPALTENSCD